MKMPNPPGRSEREAALAEARRIVTFVQEGRVDRVGGVADAIQAAYAKGFKDGNDYAFPSEPPRE